MRKALVSGGIILIVLALACLARKTHLQSSLAKVVAALQAESMPATYKPAADSEFLAGKRYWFTLENGEHFSVHVYRNSKQAQEDASYVDGGGCSYTRPGRAVNVSWAGLPHLFLKDNIIVLYVGENAEMLATLKSVFGEQFAGYSE
ncbi:MAG: hypothetical protein GX060_07250 [Firmicutes bacterium]|nr:hypothetical protein [Bacillota bacterium]